MGLSVRIATVQDAVAIGSVHVAAWRAAYAGLVPAAHLAGLSVGDRVARWVQILSEAGFAGASATRVAERDGEVLAFASHGPCRDAGAPPSRGELWALYAAPEAWGLGLGRALMDAVRAAEQAQGRDELSLWVLAGNARGRRFYEAAGFAPVPGSEQEVAIGGASLPELQYLWRARG